ncbi:unnamed protein product [Closterium sp. NIES-64]|nr:unnamed protein product [Closterium sp. NIES-64]CAI5991844.1 unnamed protein product [Closterium sp. NIES-64]
MAAKKAQKEEQQKRHAAMQAARDKKKEEQEERKEAKAARDAAKKSKSPSSPPKPAKSPKSPSPPKKSPSPSPVPPKKSPSPSPPKSPVKPTTPTPSTPKPTTPSTPSTPSKGSVNPADVSVIANLQAAATLTADAADLLTPKNQYYANLKSTEQALQNAVILINQGQRALVATQVDNSVATLNGVSVMLNKVTYKDALDLINQAKTKAATAKTDFKPLPLSHASPRPLSLSIPLRHEELHVGCESGIGAQTHG